MDLNDLDGFLYVGDSYGDADMYYLSRFLAGDRFALLAADKISILISSMEAGRAQKESCADICLSTSRYGIIEKLKAGINPDDAYIQVLIEFLEEQKIKRLGVPYRFPAGIYCGLSEHFKVDISKSPAAKAREVKSRAEQKAIAFSQEACERAMRRAVDIIAGSIVRGEMLYRGDVLLTSEAVRGEIELSLLEDGCEAVDTIVAGGVQATDPHSRGSGPIPANSPIVIDIFPRSKSSRYFADMTRTVLKGEASPEALELYEAVRLAQDAGIGAVREGVTGAGVHHIVSDSFRDQGYPEREGCGFTHSTGHGVGLDVHERPSLGAAGEVLQSGNVVTVEPGLYYPDIGAVRLEDLVVVKKEGCQNLTNFERRFVL